MLHGRSEERARIVGLVEAAHAGRGGALLVRGEPGSGKSVLLDDVAGSVDDVTVLRTQGIESEAPLPFAALQRLLRPVMTHAGQLPTPQSQALRIAFGEETGQVDRFLVFLGTLSLLAEAAEQAPVLAVVDDAHWLDDASAAGLLFVARRLQVERVALLFAARDGDARTFEAPDLDTLHLRGLDLRAATRLLGERAGATVATEVGAQLLASTGGNPLALVELPRLLSDDQLAGRAPLPGRLPVTGAVERAFLDRARRLSPEAQRLLLVASADDSTDLRTVLAASTALGAGQGALAEAEASQLVAVHEGQLRLRHPLVRSAIYAGAGSVERRQAHAALAEAMTGIADADRRAWHRAASVDVPNESVVDELDAAAARAEQRGGHEAAAAAWERAAELSADANGRARRLFGAARGAWLSGQTVRAGRLAEEARALATDPLLVADAALLRARVEWNTGSVRLAHRMVLEAARDVAPEDPSRAQEMAMFAAAVAVVGGDSGVAIDPLDFTTASTTPRDRCIAELVLTLSQVRAGDLATATATLHRLFAAAQDLELGEQDLLPNLGMAAIHLGDVQAFADYHEQLLVRARKSGAAVMVLYALTRLATSDLITGRWTDLAVRQEEAIALGEGTGQPVLVAGPVAALLVLAALRGQDDYDERLARLHEMLQGGTVGTMDVIIRDMLRWAEGLKVGPRNAASFHHFAQFGHDLGCRLAGPDRVESAVAAEQYETAQAWIADLDGFGRSTGQAWVAAAAAHGRAVLAAARGEDDADVHFEDALRLHASAPRRFDAARTELAFGEHLRRTRRRVAAREHLRAALAVFEDLGAAPWASRAATELRASGESARRRDAGAATSLTPQELQVAQLVRTGKSNREVAAELFVSPRTVDFHLRNVFSKTGVTSRTELAQLALA
jgi:DNA-binding CsgD family transcriptional regulator